MLEKKGRWDQNLKKKKKKKELSVSQSREPSRESWRKREDCAAVIKENVILPRVEEVTQHCLINFLHHHHHHQ